jgi:hypothetical protein
MMNKLALTGVAFVCTLAGLGAATSWADPMPIKGLHVFFDTTSDDKDAKDGLIIQVKRGDDIVYDSKVVHNDITFHDHKTDTWDGTLTTPVSKSDCGNLKLVVTKQNDNGWATKFRVVGDDGQGHNFDLLTQTGEVRFGKQTNVLIHKPLEGANGVKVEHWSGGNQHTFAFTCRP